MNIIKRFIVIILFFTFHNLFSQEINIFILDASSKVDSGYVYNTYTSIGFNEVNIIESDMFTFLNKKTSTKVLVFAEREGFEPPVHCCTMVFKTTAFDHSAISPADGKSKIFLVFTHTLTAKITDYIFVT